MLLTLIESPYAGDIEKNVSYAKLCVHDCLDRAEAPYASHLFFTQKGILDDNVPWQRDLGIEAGLAWGAKADIVAFYIDHGWSKGMLNALRAHKIKGKRIELRALHREITAEDYAFVIRQT